MNKIFFCIIITCLISAGCNQQNNSNNKSLQDNEQQQVNVDQEIEKVFTVIRDQIKIPFTVGNNSTESWYDNSTSDFVQFQAKGIEAAKVDPKIQIVGKVENIFLNENFIQNFDQGTEGTTVGSTVFVKGSIACRVSAQHNVPINKYGIPSYKNNGDLNIKYTDIQIYCGEPSLKITNPGKDKI